MKVGKKIIIVHHQPLELFPPTLNFLESLTGSEKSHRVLVLTSGTELDFKLFTKAGVSIKRIYETRNSHGTLKRIFNFGLFVIKSLWHLARWRPDVVMYYESHSALPVYYYFRYCRSKAKLFIHYHEYMTPAEYEQKGMRVVNYSHKREKYLYRIADWISHTNEKRIELVLQDHTELNKAVFRVMPNYPPLNWLATGSASNISDSLLRLVYVGSFGSLEHLYIRELLTWVNAMKGQIMLDIYSYNVSPEVKNFLQTLNAENVQVKGSLNYEDLPSVLTHYHVGLIFYKATSLNVEHCAPNKLFEYLTCGLDVWFSKEMSGCYPYIREDSYPKVIKVDFKNLSEFDYKKAIDRSGLSEKKSNFFAENAYAPLINKLEE